MPKRSPRIWVGPAIIAGVVLLTGAEFIGQLKAFGSPAVALVASLPMLIKSGSAALGAYLVWRGWPRQTGRGLHCRKCGYHQEDRGRIVAECPECGAPWRWIGRFRTGERRGQSWMITIGLALILVVTGSWMIRQAAPWLLLRWMPTDVLIQQLGTFPDDELTDHWNEFDERRVSAERLETLAQALVRKKARDGYLSRRGEQTVFLWISRSPAPAAAAKQYYSQLLSAAMEAAESVEEGEPVAIRTTATFRGGTIVATPEPRIVVLSALYVDGASEPAQTWIWPVRAVTDAQTRPLNHLVDAKQSGPLGVTQVFWLAIGGTGEGEASFGTAGPVLPTGMTIFDQFELTRTIAVREPRTAKPQPARPSR